jgi:formamidopyrimidine-DNA glycosylase
MPELPEVESIKRQLNKYLVGHRIKRVEINYKKCFRGDPKKIEGGKVKKIKRFGKAQVIELDNGFSLVVHIKLTGQLIYRGPNLPSRKRTLSSKITGGLDGKHTHVIFHLDRKGTLYYNDVRKFGWMKVTQSANVKTQNKFIKNLGPEPVVDPSNPPENPLTLEKFTTVVQSTGAMIKPVIMDQKKIAGVGNIYANDALFLAKINPGKKANKLSKVEVGKLYRSILEVLKKGLEYGGASELSFVTPDGSEGKYQDHTLVYGKEGRSCPNGCGGKIKKIKVGGRGTYFCPHCQK